MNTIQEGFRAEAIRNLQALRENPHPGRSVVVGLDDTGENLVQICWAVGVSTNTRNRDLERGGRGKRGQISLEVARPPDMHDDQTRYYPPKVICNVMQEESIDGLRVCVVGNDLQTDHVADEFFATEDVYTAINLSGSFSDGELNLTPRITAVSYWSKFGVPCAKMSLLRKLPSSTLCCRNLYELNRLDAGLGHCITTYEGDGAPLPTFHGEPRLVPLYGDVDQIADTFWDALNADSRVSLAVKVIPQRGPSYTKTINEYPRS